ncbi:MAG: sulfatase-like hydrolase/transferase, partial [Fuerstia sp.]|nr:sulfatase-like hydrolase/transferase [Fuerstiella sp.]
MSLNPLCRLLISAAVVVLAAVSNRLLMAAERPNVILVITDDQGYPPIAKLGHPWIRTPHLDALHDASTRFSRFFVCPTCSPT